MAQCAAFEGFDVATFDSCVDRDTRAVSSRLQLADLNEPNLESFPEDVRVLLAGGTEENERLLGVLASFDKQIVPDRIKLMRNWERWRDWAAASQIGFPETHRSSFSFTPQKSQLSTNRTWLRKKLASAGGLGVQKHVATDPWPEQGVLIQEWISGTSFGVTFLSSRFGTLLLGMTESVKLEPHPWSDFIYRGSLGPFRTDPSVQKMLVDFGNLVASQSGYQGLWQADFLATHEHLYLLEINPRWTAGMEILEFGWNLPLVTWHCQSVQVSNLHWGQWIEFLKKRQSLQEDVIEKQVVYAPCDFVPDEDLLESWWDRRWIESFDKDGIWYADIPATTQRIPSGYPICSLISRDPVRQRRAEELHKHRSNVESFAFRRGS